MTHAHMSCWFLLLMILTNGCASATKERIAIPPAQEAGRRPPAVQVDEVDRKIARLEGLVKEKRIKLEDEALAMVIIEAYQSAKTCLDENPQTPCDRVNHDLFQGLSLVEERYFSRNVETLSAPTPVSALPPATRRDGEDPGRLHLSGPSEAVEKPLQEGRPGNAGAPLQMNGETLRGGARPGTNGQAPGSVEESEEQHLRERIERMALIEKGLSRAKQLVEAEKFEEAIAAIDTFSVEGPPNEASRALLDEAVAGIVKRERNQAAKAFYAAKQTDDPVRKEAYLRASHDILNNLLYKYNSSTLIEKIKANLETVKSEMAKLGLKP